MIFACFAALHALPRRSYICVVVGGLCSFTSCVTQILEDSLIAQRDNKFTRYGSKSPVERAHFNLPSGILGMHVQGT